jgi:hypothetical protein
LGEILRQLRRGAAPVNLPGTYCMRLMQGLIARPFDDHRQVNAKQTVAPSLFAQDQRRGSIRARATADKVSLNRTDSGAKSAADNAERECIQFYSILNR